MSIAEVAIIGAGPAASSLLERIGANAAQMLDGRRLRVHLIDPHRAGTGRVWRADNHAGLWMNSLAEDVTMFTDDSVVIEGPVRPGPTLFEWAQSVDDATLAELATPSLVDEIRSLTATTFPTRGVQSVYLEWFHRLVVASLPANVDVVVHRATAVDLVDDGEGRQTIDLDGGSAPLTVDIAVLALGHLDAEPDPISSGLATFAAEHGLVRIGAGHTAELDLSGLEPGADVIATGFGQAFTDLMVLVTEGRGGQFIDDGSGGLKYEPSGLEPVIHVGSRRGVPYLSKIDYHLQASPAPLPKFLDEATIQALLHRDALLDFRRDVLPLVRKEVGWAYYHELFHAHPTRVTISWDEFCGRLDDARDHHTFGQIVADAVADPDDIFDIERLDAPLAGLEFETVDDLHRHVRDHIAADIARRTDPNHSADLGAFNALLFSFGVIARISASGRIGRRSRIEDVGGWWFSFFMYYASGPPPARLRQLLALEEQGLVRFIGANTTVRADSELGMFVASSTSHPDELVAGASIDAVIASASISRTADTMLQRLRERGEIVEEVVEEIDGDGTRWHANTGKLVVTGAVSNVMRSNGRPHPFRHALGAFTSRPVAGAFSRPRTNAPTFRQNDAVARSILHALSNQLADGCTGAADA